MTSPLHEKQNKNWPKWAKYEAYEFPKCSTDLKKFKLNLTPMLFSKPLLDHYGISETKFLQNLDLWCFRAYEIPGLREIFWEFWAWSSRIVNFWLCYWWLEAECKWVTAILRTHFGCCFFSWSYTRIIPSSRPKRYTIKTLQSQLRLWLLFRLFE